jgi:Zn finger protein HypA/HybF involved in hydrogenase expression
MSKIMIKCKHCGQKVKEENTRSGYCYKERSKMYKNDEGKIISTMVTYLNCGRYI